MSSIGYNVNLSAIDNTTQNDVTLAGANMHLLMTVPQQIDRVGVNGQTEINQIADWKQAISPAKSVWRTYSEKEGDWKIFPSNDVIIMRWLNEGQNDVIRDDPANEPSLAGGDKLINVQYVASRVDLLEQASAVEIKVAVGAFSVGTPHQDRINDGTYDPLIRAVVEGGHYFSVHEYCPGIPGAGDVFQYDELLNPQTVLSKMFSELWPLGDYWLLRRSDRFVSRALQTLKIEAPQIIVTEAFIDNIGDASEVLNQLRDKYGLTECNRDMRGVLAWRPYYHDAFDGIHSDHQLQVDYLVSYLANEVYNVDWIKGVCLFALNRDWDSPECHNWLNNSLNEFRRVFLPNINYNLELPPPKPPILELPPPPEDWKMKYGLISFSLEGGSNIRSEYSTLEDNDIGKIRDVPLSGMISTETVENEGFKWHKVVLDTLVGYFAKTGYVTITRLDIEPPLPPEIDYDKIQTMIDKSISDVVWDIAKTMLELAENKYPKEDD